MSTDHSLDKNYDPQTVEPAIYERWEQSGAFRSQPDGRPHDETFTIVIPPPNVTGALHLGHALNNTLQDILIRYHRMRGFNTLWQPGTDHAGIATQAVVERRIRETEGKTRHQLGATEQEAREELVRRIWAWKDAYEARIISQLKLMGCSCDWDRTRFTLDDGLARAVRHMFFNLFKDGLIFRGKRLVNWDTQLQTAVSDDEVYYETVQGQFWHIRYPILLSEPRASARANKDHESEPRTSVRADVSWSDEATKRRSHEGKSHSIDDRRSTIDNQRGATGGSPASAGGDASSLDKGGVRGVDDQYRDREGAGTGATGGLSASAIDGGTAELDYLIIATTRPETMLGDTAVAVHPDPERFFAQQEHRLKDELEKASPKERPTIQAKLEGLAERRDTHLARLIQLRDMAKAGRKLLLPLVDRVIPLICDEWADPTKGSGCVKITPAHDPNDYEVGQRHNLPMINVLTPDGKIARIVEQPDAVIRFPDGQFRPIADAGDSTNPYSAEYEGLAFSTEGRAKVVAALEARGLLDHAEDHEIELGHSDRSKLPIEPFLSDQWFLKTGDAIESQDRNHQDAKTPSEEREERSSALLNKLPDGAHGLAQAAIDVVENGQIKVFPARYAKSYLDWLGEKRDWCISRQLWWGHRIPVWHKNVRLNEDNWVENLSGSAGLDSIMEDRWASDAALTVVQSDTGERIDPRRDLMPVVAETEGAYDLYVCCQTEPEPSRFLEPDGFTRDPDVLDTWFSSALWPFSTMGWPDETEHLKQYYPGLVLCTSRDIITNWVARMVMFGLYAMGRVPFDHVYIHPKILDGRGETMSKSKGNGVDPVDIIHTHGADALRYTMADMTTETQDIRMPVEYVCPHCGKLTDQTIALKAEEQSRKSRGIRIEGKLQPSDCHRVTCVNADCKKEFATQWADATTKKELTVARETSDKFDIGRNFCNKLWNAARFAFMNLEGAPCEPVSLEVLQPEDCWILARLSQTIRRYHEHIADYQFSASVKELREFFWDSLCDWYIELTKPRLTSEPRTSARADENAGDEVTKRRSGEGTENPDPVKQVLAFCLDQMLRLWHPTIPFITERLWQSLNAIVPQRGLPGVEGVGALDTNNDLIRSAFPPVGGYAVLEDERIVTTFARLQDATRAVRDLRAQCDVPPKNRVTVTVVVPPDGTDAFRAQAHIVKHMAGIGELSVVTDAKRPKNAGTVSVGGMRIYVHDISDDEAERQRTTKALKDIEKQIAGKESKLANEKFVSNAKPDVVEAERQRLAELQAQHQSLAAHLSELGD